jgi:hypothetical protein
MTLPGVAVSDGASWFSLHPNNPCGYAVDVTVPGNYRYFLSLIPAPYEAGQWTQSDCQNVTGYVQLFWKPLLGGGFGPGQSAAFSGTWDGSHCKLAPAGNNTKIQSSYGWLVYDGQTFSALGGGVLRIAMSAYINGNPVSVEVNGGGFSTL